MVNAPNKLTRFWQELKRRKVLPFVIGYIAASIAIISFLLDSSDIFSVAEDTIRLLYLLAAVGLPIVMVLSWFIYRKKSEEIEELREAMSSGEVAELEDELGDVLFTCVNLARHLGLDAETALRRSSNKFEDRFRRMESIAGEEDRTLAGSGAKELDRLWRSVKSSARTSPK